MITKPTSWVHTLLLPLDRQKQLPSDRTWVSLCENENLIEYVICCITEQWWGCGKAGAGAGPPCRVLTSQLPCFPHILPKQDVMAQPQTKRKMRNNTQPRNNNKKTMLFADMFSFHTSEQRSQLTVPSPCYQSQGSLSLSWAPIRMFYLGDSHSPQRKVLFCLSLEALGGLFHHKLCCKSPWRSQSHQNIKVKDSPEDSGLWSTNLPEWCQPAQSGNLGVDNNRSHEGENNTTVWPVWDLSSLTISQKGSDMVGIADSIWSADLGQQAMTPLLSHDHHHCLVFSDTKNKTGWEVCSRG